MVAERPTAGDFASQPVVVDAKLLNAAISHEGKSGRNDTVKLIVVQVQMTDSRQTARAFGPVQWQLAAELIVTEIQIVHETKSQVRWDLASKVVFAETQNTCSKRKPGKRNGLRVRLFDVVRDGDNSRTRIAAMVFTYAKDEHRDRHPKSQYWQESRPSFRCCPSTD